MIYISICSTHHALSKHVKIFEKFHLIIRDTAILSEMCMELGKNTHITTSNYDCK
jgi:hypothetical protein